MVERLEMRCVGGVWGVRPAANQRDGGRESQRMKESRKKGCRMLTGTVDDTSRNREVDLAVGVVCRDVFWKRVERDERQVRARKGVWGGDE